MSTRFEDDPDQMTECYISTAGSLLGRVLYAMGVPTGGQESRDFTPPFLWYDMDLARVYISAWILHHGQLNGERLRIGTAYGADEWAPRALAELARERLGWTIHDQNEKQWTVSYQEVRPDLTEALHTEVVEMFEREQ